MNHQRFKFYKHSTEYYRSLYNTIKELEELGTETFSSKIFNEVISLISLPNLKPKPVLIELSLDVKDDCRGSKSR